MNNPTLIAGTQFNAPFNILPDKIYLNPSTTAGTQFTAPFNILPDIIFTKPPNNIFQLPKPIEFPAVVANIDNPLAPYFGDSELTAAALAAANWKAPHSASTNINLGSSAAKLFNFAGLSFGSATGVPQVSQLVDNLTNQFPEDKLSGTYSTLNLGQLKRIPGVEYADFRSRYNIDSVASATLQRRLDGASAGLRGSGTALAYSAATLTPAGAYSIINLNTKYGWGFHDAPGAIRSDFTARSHVAKQWLPGETTVSNAKYQDSFGSGNFKPPTSTYVSGKWIKTKKILEKATPFRGDRVSVIDFSQRTISHAYEWNPVFTEEQGPVIGNIINKAGITQDFIKFYMTGPKLVNGDALATDDIIVFRATLGSLSDSFQGNWTPITMIGRADPNYQYTGFNRDVSLDFTVYATDRDELQPIWRKLNALAGYTAPTYLPDSIAMQAPWMRITVGDLFVQQPVLLTTLDYTLHDADTSWEINIENDPTMMEVPFKVTVRCSFTMISDYLPQKGGRFYTLAKKFDEAGTAIRGNNNWLSDTLDNVDAQPPKNQARGDFDKSKVKQKPM